MRIHGDGGYLARRLRSRTLRSRFTVAGAYSRYWEPYLLISAVYLVITLTLSALAKRLEAPAHLRGR